MSVRTTVHLEEGLAEKVRELVPSRGVNRFINEAVAEKVQAIERKKIEDEMRRGYIARRNEDLEIAADWEAVDLEHWPEWKE
jgi:metal-responsive CopG/Arc/MetJ family transcriptional regulator